MMNVKDLQVRRVIFKIGGFAGQEGGQSLASGIGRFKATPLKVSIRHHRVSSSAIQS